MCVTLQLLLLLEPLDYSADVIALLERGMELTSEAPLASETIWNLQPLAAWAACEDEDQGEQAPRPASAASAAGVGGAARKPSAFAVFGGAGEGKSTLSAVLVAAAGGVRQGPRQPGTEARRTSSMSYSYSSQAGQLLPLVPVHVSARNAVWCRACARESACSCSCESACTFVWCHVCYACLHVHPLFGAGTLQATTSHAWWLCHVTCMVGVPS